MAFSSGQLLGGLPDSGHSAPSCSSFSHLPLSHRTINQQVAQPYRLRHRSACSSRTTALWGSSLVCNKQHHSRHQQRGQALVVHAEQDYYNVLGIDKNADKQAIKTAYRQKARKFHPDVNKDPGAEDTFKKISAAYEVLSDDQKRGIYDR